MTERLFKQYMERKENFWRIISTTCLGGSFVPLLFILANAIVGIWFEYDKGGTMDALKALGVFLGASILSYARAEYLSVIRRRFK